MKKKFSKELLKNIVIFILIGICGGLTIWNLMLHTAKQPEAKVGKIIYEQANDPLEEVGFYPGRAYGDYYDLVFCFDDYLNSIGADEIQRYIYTSGEVRNYELRFKYDGFDYVITTTEFSSEPYTYSYYSRIEAKNEDVTFIVPVENCGTHICDATSPFKIDWIIFDVFHAATDKDSRLKKELRAGLEETNCPFYGLGIDHYEKWNNGETIQHDDLGNFTFEDGLDLHY